MDEIFRELHQIMAVLVQLIQIAERAFNIFFNDELRKLVTFLSPVRPVTRSASARVMPFAAAAPER